MKNTIVLETQTDYLEFERSSLRLVSFCSKKAPAQNFIIFSQTHPAFEIGILDSQKNYRIISSHSALDVQVQNVSESEITAVYHSLEGQPIDVACTVRAASSDRFASWNITVDNRCAFDIVDVQYPFIVCPYTLDDSETEAVVLPHGYGSGQLLTGDLKFGSSTLSQRMRADSYLAWEFCSREGDCNHYPGMQYAQYMAYYNNKAGFYMACNDTEANIKRFKVLHREPGMRFGVSHVGDWPENGVRQLEYDILMTSFSGDWYDATDIYREWSMQQKWFVPLTQKDNVPAWLIDSPAYITIRPAGILDFGQVMPVEEFLPYEKCIPLLENVAAKVEADLAIILMGWEHAGSWVYPDAFPPAGGEESMINFISQLKERGWRAGCFNSGMRWAYDQTWSGYDGRDYLEKINASAGIARQADGSLWKENWDSAFRSSYAGCLATPKMRSTALSIVGHLIDWGMESIQFLDQNNGGSTFPCFSDQHQHLSKPGKWMHSAMKSFVEEMHQLADEKMSHSVVHSAESGLNETCLPLFQETELRIYPDNYGSDTIPIYQYLFHECIVLQGMMGNAPEPYHLTIRNAVNCVLGSIPGGVLTGDGTLLDKDTNNWANWDPKIENSDQAFEMIRTVLKLRRGPGKPYLVFGRMLRPAVVQGIKRVEWAGRQRQNSIDAVFHSAWQSPDGSLGIVLANWTDETHQLTVKDSRIKPGSAITVHFSERTERVLQTKYHVDGQDVAIPAHACVIITCTEATAE